MKRTLASISLLAFTLTGCMGGGETQDEELQAEAQAQAASASSTVQFSYPIAGQSGFPASAPLIVRYGMPVTTPESEIGPENLILEIQDGESFTEVDNPEQLIQNVRIVGGGQTLRVDTGRDLQPGARYRLTVTGLSVNGEITGTEEIEFTTAPNRSTGTVTQRLSADAEDITDFRVTGLTPFSTAVDGSSLGQGSSNFPITNHNTLRVVFTQPVDENTVDYGPNGVQLQDADGNPVNDVEVWTRGNRMTIDPEGVLKAGENYELRFSEKLKSALTQEPLAGDRTWEFTPQEARPVLDDGSIAKRAPLVQDAVDGSAGKVRYTGNDYNSVVLGATTLGQGNKTLQRGTVTAHLGDLQRFESEGKAVPLTVERGTLMKGTSVDVLVGGELQTEFEESGEIDVRFLSDANGYMMMNPYSDSDNAPRVIRLFADLSMNTDKPKANGALAQELLHVELVGTAQIIDGKLTLEAVSVIQPDVLGVDKASGLISFRLEAYNDPEDAPEGLSDSSGPQLKAWTPGENHQDKMQPQDSISLFFSEPLLPSTVQQSDAISLRENGHPVEAQIRQNGANVIIDPAEALDYGNDYDVFLDRDVLTDLAGNSLSESNRSAPDLAFSLPASKTGKQQLTLNRISEETTDIGPLVLTARPGYPCAKVNLTVDDYQPEQEGNGRCRGGIGEDPNANRESVPGEYFEDDQSQKSFFPEDSHLFTSDDQLPIEGLRQDEAITVRFSQNMELESINTETFVVQKWQSGQWRDVPVTLEKTLREVRAIPDQEWEKGTPYQYILKTHPNPTEANPAIQSKSGVPLYTKILHPYRKNGRPLADFGKGGDTVNSHWMVNRFKVKGDDGRVATPLSNLPTEDSNGNLTLDPVELAAAETEAGEKLEQMDVDQSSPLAEQITSEDSLPNSAAMEVASVTSDVVENAAIGCARSESTCGLAKKMIFKTAKLDVDLLSGSAVWNGQNGELTGVPVELHPSVLFTSSSDVVVELSNDFLEVVATGSDEPSTIPTGPMVMRMRYQGEQRNEFIDGIIYQGDNGLRFRTKLDVYLDAPYLVSKLSSGFITTYLEDNMRSFPINDLTLDGPVKFFEDGRMQIEQKNLDVIPLKVKLKGAIKVGTDTSSSCPDWDIFCQIFSETATALINPDTTMNLEIPKGALHLNYITPYTQKEE